MVFAVVLVALLLVGVPFLLSASTTRPNHLGIRLGRFAPCPETPNCVSSEAADPRHAIAPIRFSGSAKQAMQTLREVIEQLPSASIITADPDYLHLEFTSPFFRFVDDVEFRIDEARQEIHFRSASRIGRFDFGANRRRMESICSAFRQFNGSTR